VRAKKALFLQADQCNECRLSAQMLFSHLDAAISCLTEDSEEMDDMKVKIAAMKTQMASSQNTDIANNSLPRGHREIQQRRTEPS
jgi:hypothetical protein